MRPLAVILKAVAAIVACLVAADIVGAIVCTILDVVVPTRFISGLLFYAAWLVIGVYSGMIAYNAAGAWSSPKVAGRDWIEQPEAKRLGGLIVATGGTFLVALALSYGYLFGIGPSDAPYVPDNALLTLVFLAATLGGMVAARIGAMPSPGQSKGMAR